MKIYQQLFRPVCLLGSLCFCSLSSGGVMTVDFGQNVFTAVHAGDAPSVTRSNNGINANGGSPAIVTYTVSGLTIDGNGTSDDKLKFTIALTGPGSGGVLGFGAFQGFWGVNSVDSTDSANLFDRVGESIAFSLASAPTVTLGAGGTDAGVVSFLGFTGFDTRVFGSSDRYSLAGTSIDGLSKSLPNPTFDPTQAFTVGYASGNGFRISGIEASFDVSSTAATVPEPSTLAVFSTCCIGMLARRSKRSMESV